MRRALVAALTGLLLSAAASARPTTVPLADVPVTLQTPEVVAPNPGEMLRVSLLTFAPGAIYWQRFGHNALLVENTATGANAVYNYGMFDFFQKNFFLNFARGHMVYRLDVDTLERTVEGYRREGRWVYRQVLALDAAERLQLAQFLEHNARPENAEYRYDYFRDNCSTRVRDALDRLVGGALKADLEARATPVSYRFEATRLVTPIPALMAGMDFIMGPNGDPPINVWQQSFVPEVLMQAVRSFPFKGRPLVEREGFLLADERAPVAPAQPLALMRYLAPLGLLLAAALLLTGTLRRHRAARWTHALLASLLVLATGIAGLAMVATWTLTEHWSMWANRNLLLASPLALLLLPMALVSARARWQVARWQRRLAMALAVAALVTLPLMLLPSAQQHGPWIALLLPIQLALAYTLHRAPRR